MTKFDVLVIGAGINGLAATYYLSDHKNLKIGLVDQFTFGHPHGSSHGFSRIFRTTYLNPVYINLARRAAFHEWPFLEERLGCKLLHPNSRCMDDPDIIDSKPDEERILTLEKFVKKQFVGPFIKTERIETCFYTSTPTEDFVLDFLPQDHRIVVGSACSGHAFKFAPVIGKILSELVLYGRTTIPEFEANRQLFTLKFDGK
ncbi:MAG: FAD-dependent oxidoreductase [Parachlamydiaceae bacterium]|nr:FAD-dependent oxidoreductase [Parachlamydiaceae bacterium]